MSKPSLNSRRRVVEVNKICEVCCQPIDDMYNCLCVKGKPSMGAALHWLSESDIFEPHERSQLVNLIKMLDTPIDGLDQRWVIQPQLAAAVATLRAKYLRESKRKSRLAERKEASLLLNKRKKYQTALGSKDNKPWKLWEKEVVDDEKLNVLQEEVEDRVAALTLLEDIVRILHKRGDSLTKMSDDRRQLRRIDSVE